jgi:serine/threonine-protein kinase RsbW
LTQTVLRVPGPALGDRGARFELRLARLRPLVRLARQDLRRWLEAQGVDAVVVEDVALACSEASANAVEHPADAVKQAFEIEARRDERRLQLLVRDFGHWTEQRRTDVRGRGLRMLESLMDSVDVQSGSRGTQVVMTRSLTRSAATPLR